MLLFCRELKENAEIASLIDTSTLPSTLISTSSTPDGKVEDEKLVYGAPPDPELCEKLSKYVVDPDVCPLLGKDLAGLPPAMVCTAGVDILKDEGVLYARRMQSFGVPVQWNHYESAFHGIIHMPGSKQRKQILDDVSQYLQKNL